MSENLTASSLLAALALAVPTLASASVVDVNQTIDLTAIDLSATTLMNWYTAPVSLAVGDTLNLTYDFAGNQTLKMTNPNGIYGWLYASDGGCTTFQASGSLSFVGAVGPVRTANKTQSNACAHFGLNFDQNEFTSAPGPIEFSGMKFSMTVDAYDNLTSRSYGGPWFMVSAGRFEIGREVAADVPEPASLGLLGLGVAALVASRKQPAK